MKTKLISILLPLTALAFVSCSTNMQPGVKENPPPAFALRSAASYELRPLEVDEKIRKREPNVVRWMQDKIDAQVRPTIVQWNSLENNKASNKAKLIITPKVDKLKFISTGERIMVGAFAGGSAIQTSFDIRDALSGQQIANPIFYQHAHSWGSSYSYGATDREMLNRVVQLMNRYLVENYQQAVGGKTGDES